MALSIGANRTEGLILQSFTGDAIKAVLTVAISAAVGWLLSSLNKVSRKDLENELKRIEEALADQKRQISKAFDQNGQMMTRSEFRDAIDDIRERFDKQFDSLKSDLRGDIQALRELILKK